ncbi:response regulator transcription factor [Psychromonas sp. KJ10-10]|uniref:response regulator transcription factor n=1 Tax=Psychromonas sp. KJ10-10 TaxID=3391823 RepID=UPI0039B4D216
MKILVVEDELQIADIVQSGLSERGFEVSVFSTGHLGFEVAKSGEYSAIVLDIMLPGRDGLDILSSLRALGNQTPVLLLTARNELGDRVHGLELGADDYLAKPFFVEELVARINALLRRQSGEREHILEAGALILDCIKRQASCNGESVKLTSREFTLLEYLMRSPKQVFTRGQILEHVWGYDFDPLTNVVDVCVKRIREKIKAIDINDQVGWKIVAVRGTGYRLVPCS